MVNNVLVICNKYTQTASELWSLPMVAELVVAQRSPNNYNANFFAYYSQNYFNSQQCL